MLAEDDSFASFTTFQCWKCWKLCHQNGATWSLQKKVDLWIIDVSDW